MARLREGLLLSIFLACISSLLLLPVDAAGALRPGRIVPWTRLGSRRWSRGDTERLKQKLEAQRPAKDIPMWMRPTSFVPLPEDLLRPPPDWIGRLRQRIQGQGGYKVPSLNRDSELEAYTHQLLKPDHVKDREQAQLEAGPEKFVDPANYRPPMVRKLAPWQIEVESNPHRRLDQEYRMAKVLLGNSPLPSTGHSYRKDARRKPVVIDVGSSEDRPLLDEYPIKRSPGDFVPSMRQEAQIKEQDHSFERVMEAMEREAEEKRLQNPHTHTGDLYGDMDDLYG